MSTPTRMMSKATPPAKGEEWEKEFDEQFWFDVETSKWESSTYTEGNHDIMDYIKDFISSLRSQAHEEGKREGYADGLEEGYHCAYSGGKATIDALTIKEKV